MAISTTYFVIPDHYSLHYQYTNNNTFPLQHYLNNTNKYFASHCQLHFLPGHYYINNDLVFKDIENFTVTGQGINQSVIVCSSPASIMAININGFTFQNISINDCMTLSEDITTICYVSIFLSLSNSILMNNIYVNIAVHSPAALTAIYALNVAKSKFINVKVQINTSICNKNSVVINGLAIYYNNYNTNMHVWPDMMIENFIYSTQKPCLKNKQCAIGLMLVHIHGKFHFIIQKTVFTNLSNSSAFCYYSIADDESTDEDDTTRSILIKDVTVSHNTGYGNMNMFQIVFFSLEVTDNDSQRESLNNFYTNGPIRIYNTLEFNNCNFTDNTNIDVMIYIRPSTYSKVVGHINISNSKFFNNKDVPFINVARKFQDILNVITYVSLANVIVSNNEHRYDGSDLISVTNGRLYFSNTDLTTNHYYENLIHLSSSVLYFTYKNKIFKNYARHIIKAQRDSFLFVHLLAIVNISNNVIYKVIKHVSTMENLAVPICPLQFYDPDPELNKQFDNLDQTFLSLNNTEMISKLLSSDITSFINKSCAWLEGTIFKETKFNASTVYHKIAKFSNTFIGKTAKRIIPLSVCPCLQSDSYNCYLRNLGSVFPGQTLHIKLIISQRWSKLSSTIVVANTREDDCNIVDNYQLSQSYFKSHDCNKYSYTIWPNNRFTTECKLFIGLTEMPEMFYVQIKPCPVGFTLQSSKKSCYCDPLLSTDIISITSCNVNDETIQRPANSWISAETKNSSHTYYVSPQCPFDYCLPHASNLNLSNPDSQCQLKRSGVMCGECQQGLSTVFGSSNCKQCSNVYLLLVIPIAIAGVVLVIMLFTFNLTVTNGIINTFIFYVNIISINYSQFCYDSNSPDCTILSLLNLDLGIKTCFYDGMDGYTKMWLQLVFPSYLMIISFTLIFGSRHSSKLQRLTANRILKVLATLFLLSYTKILLSVCQVLYFFSSVTHLPSKHTSLVWSVDSGV